MFSRESALARRLLGAIGIVAGLAVGLAAELGCGVAEEQSSDGVQGEKIGPAEPREGASEDGHEHEALPRRVKLSAEVIAAGGIASVAIQRTSVAPVIEAIGQLEADPARTFEVAAKVAGVVHKVSFSEGEEVVKGQPLVIIRAPSLGGLRAEFAAQKARASSAKANVARLEVLAGQSMASKQELASTRAEARALAAEAQAAKQRLRALGLRTQGSASTFILRSPATGVITECAVIEGEAVTEDDTIATITNLDEAWFQAQVFEHTLALVEVGAAAEVVLNAYPDRPLLGRVDLLSPMVDRRSRTITARVIIKNPDGVLRLGLFGRARIATTDAPPAPVLAVPRSALIDVEDQPVVFVDLGGGVYERHDVTVGAEGPGLVEITHGLSEGERVVDRGAWSLKSVLLRGTLGED